MSNASNMSDVSLRPLGSLSATFSGLCFVCIVTVSNRIVLHSYHCRITPSFQSDKLWQEHFWYHRFPDPLRCKSTQKYRLLSLRSNPFNPFQKLREKWFHIEIQNQFRIENITLLGWQRGTQESIINAGKDILSGSSTKVPAMKRPNPWTQTARKTILLWKRKGMDGYQFKDARFSCSLPVQTNGLRSKERQNAGDGYNPVMDLQRSYVTAMWMKQLQQFVFLFGLLH